VKEPKRIELPCEILMGPGVIDQIGEVCGRLPLGKRSMIIADEKTFEIAGARVRDILKSSGFKVCYVLIEKSDMETVKAVRNLARRKNVEFMLGVGGGKCVDVAKLASFEEGKPFLSVPTAASHDGIASARASIKGGKKLTSIGTRPPIAVVADTLIIKLAPYRLLASGCGDLVANITAVRDWELAHRLRGEAFSEYAAALSSMSAQLIIKNAAMIKKHTEESVRKVVKALISSGVAMGIAGSSRPASGSEHLFSHALDQIVPQPALHGEQCGVGAIMMSYLQGGNWRKIRTALKTIGCPINANELGIEPRYIVEALVTAHKIRPDRYTILGDGLSRRKAEEVASTTGVI
jgi:glycerol-1-phosphate dehydrogenase [NAD(P)+]